MNKFLKFISENILPSKAPSFWREKNDIAQLLLPFSLIYFLVKRLIPKCKNPKNFNAKIICIGNAIAGGAGKTPTAIAIYNFLKLNNPSKKIAFINTGYKGILYGAVLVDNKNHKPSEVGDEAYLLSQTGDCIMCKNRLQACEYAESLGYEILILDDGLHDERIIKDFSLCVFDGNYAIGNGMVMPAGPLRDRLDFCLKDVNDILIIGEHSEDLPKRIEKLSRKKLEFHNAYIEITSNHNKEIAYTAFAGIGNPEKFFKTLENIGLSVVEKVIFPDHHKYYQDDFNHLKTLAEAEKSQLITTEKDYIKLSDEMKKITDYTKMRINISSQNLLAKINELVK
ncbi:MAG: tetraacyldisaccharide 4'-kinase [Rickettsiales bacterium]|nr:tetraacyldisaccharide 4'-kinase [Rickettsiales bacterium]